MSIYVITHKYIEDKPKLSEFYKWLYVGAYRTCERRKEYCYDDIGEKNISEKNGNYCELTGMYWIRHNCDDTIKGLVHYRRFFTKNVWSENAKFYLSEKDVINLLSKYDCIVSDRKYFSKRNIAENYRCLHNGKDLDLLEEVMASVYPDYMDAFHQSMSKTFFFPYNMLIANAEIFNAYTDWLIEILQNLEKVEYLEGYDTYQSRVYGFLAERLLHVWLIKNGISFIEMPTIQLGSRLRYKVRTELEKALGRSLYFLAKLDDIGGKKL